MKLANSSGRALAEILKLPAAKLEAIIKIKRKIERLKLQLDNLTKSGKNGAQSLEKKRRKRGPMSAESRKKMATAAETRWARVKAAKKT